MTGREECPRCFSPAEGARCTNPSCGWVGKGAAPLPDPVAEAMAMPPEGLRHTDAVETEREAASGVRNKAARLRALVTEHAIRAGRAGLTTDEVVRSTGEEEYSIRPRFTELGRDGVLVRTGEKRRNRRGNPEQVWAWTGGAS